MRPEPKYYHIDDAPMRWWGALPLLLSIGFFLNLGTVLQLWQVNAALSILVLAYSVALFLSGIFIAKMKWKGVIILLSCVGVNICGTLLLGITMGFDTKSVADIVVMSIFLAANYIYFSKRRPLFKPYNGVVSNCATATEGQTPSNEALMTSEQEAKKEKIAKLSRKSAYIACAAALVACLCCSLLYNYHLYTQIETLNIQTEILETNISALRSKANKLDDKNFELREETTFFENKVVIMQNSKYHRYGCQNLDMGKEYQFYERGSAQHSGKPCADCLGLDVTISNLKEEGSK